MTAPRAAITHALATLVAALASAAAQEPLTLATVLAKGPALQAPLPRVLWLPGGHDVTVVRAGAEGKEALFAVADGKLADNPLAEAEALWKALGQPVPAPCRFPPIAWHTPGVLRVALGTSIHHWQPGAPTTTVQLTWPAPDAADAPAAVVAPGDRHVVFRRHHQVWLGGHDGRLRQLTFDGGPDVVYGNAAHRAEFGIDRGIFWSPDGRYAAFTREDQRPIAVHPYQDVEASPPAPSHGRYPMAGSTHGRVTVAVVDSTDGSVRWLDHDPAADLYWTNLTFGPDAGLYVVHVDRGQDDLELVRYDARTGKRGATLLREHDPQWVEPEHGPTFLADGRFLWWSSQHGHRHLYLHAADGTLQKQLTKGAFDVQQLCGTSPEGKYWYQASGEDPRQLHLFEGALDSDEVRQVTRERGVHRVELAPDGKAAAVTWSNLETRPAVRLLDVAQGTVTALPEATDPLAAYTLPVQRLFQIKAEDDTVLYGHLALPPNLAEGQKCPVLLYVYGGPHVQLVTDQWLGGAPLWLQALAAEGIAVCRLDNRGTPNRGIEFEQTIHRRLGAVEVQDQLRAVEWLTQQPFVDPAKIAVHGWSYGGYLTLRLLLAAPTTFACGISGAPVTDWAMYETGYGERYMDLPEENPQGYQESSCLPFVNRLQRPLLLVQGSDDRTVVWSHTLRFLDRCIDAGVAVDYFVFPGQQHGLVGKDRAYFLNQLRSYLRKHLLGDGK